MSEQHQSRYSFTKSLPFLLLKPTLLLGGFALIGVVVLGIVNILTQPRIVANEQLALTQQLSEVMAQEQYNNHLLESSYTLPSAPFADNKPATIYIAQYNGTPTHAIFSSSTPHGYSGSIHFVIGIRLSNQTITGVRVVSHKETPGLGDKIEISKSQWITLFNDKSLKEPSINAWAVKKDGGSFDQFTGATITPRALVNAVRSILLWVKNPHNLQQLKATTHPSSSLSQASQPKTAGASSNE